MFGRYTFIYYINKQRILQKKTKRIAKSFAQGFKRKACFELFRIYTDCLADGLSAANGKIEKIRQKALGYLFGNKIPQNGESHTDFAARLVQIFYNDEYNRAIADSFERIAESKKYFEELCDVAADTIGDEKELLEAVMPYRELELYNKHVNAQHCEITTGDIFEIDGFPYLLVSQACDTYLRSDGCRELKQATLLRIVDSVGEKKYSYSLSCYAGMKKPTVIFRNLKQIPFEILDLCVCNVSGQAMVDVGDIKKYEPALLRYTKNYQLRFHSVVEKLVKIHSNSGLIAAFFEDSNSTPALEVQKAITEMKSTDPALMEYESVGTGLSYRVKRVCRLNELTTIDIIKEYGIMLSRIGHPFDFVDDKR